MLPQSGRIPGQQLPPVGNWTSKEHAGETPFLKEFVKPKRFPLGFLRTGSNVRNRLFLVGGRVVRLRHFVFLIHLGRRRCGKLRSFFSKRDCSRHIPSRGTSRNVLREALPRRGRR
jgi:hypothetical protein